MSTTPVYTQGSLDSMERGTVEWNTGMVERWNGGIVEWWDDGLINDPVPFLLITGPIGHAQIGLPRSVQAFIIGELSALISIQDSRVCKQCMPWIHKVGYHHETMPVHVLCIANGSLYIGITTTVESSTHQSHT